MGYQKNDPSRASDTNAIHDPISGTTGVHQIGTGAAACGAAAYWRDNFKGRLYAENATSFDDYGPAYGYAVSSYAKYPGRSFDDVEADLSRNWDGARGASSLQWDQARNATRNSWERIGSCYKRNGAGSGITDAH